MTNPFRDQEKFMRACDQTVDTHNENQYKLYLDLMEEEWKELKVALDSGDRVEHPTVLHDLRLPMLLAILSIPLP